MLPLTPEVARQAVNIALERAGGDGTWTPPPPLHTPLCRAGVDLERFPHELRNEIESYLCDGEWETLEMLVREPMALGATIDALRHRTLRDIRCITELG